MTFKEWICDRKIEQGWTNITLAQDAWNDAHKNGYQEAIKDCLAAGSMGGIEKLARQEGIDNDI